VPTRFPPVKKKTTLPRWSKLAFTFFSPFRNSWNLNTDPVPKTPLFFDHDFSFPTPGSFCFPARSRWLPAQDPLFTFFLFPRRAPRRVHTLAHPPPSLFSSVLFFSQRCLVLGEAACPTTFLMLFTVYSFPFLLAGSASATVSVPSFLFRALFFFRIRLVLCPSWSLSDAFFLGRVGG